MSVGTSWVIRATRAKTYLAAIFFECQKRDFKALVDLNVNAWLGLKHLLEWPTLNISISKNIWGNSFLLKASLNSWQNLSFKKSLSYGITFCSLLRHHLPYLRGLIKDSLVKYSTCTVQSTFTCLKACNPMVTFWHSLGFLTLSFG